MNTKRKDLKGVEKLLVLLNKLVDKDIGGSLLKGRIQVKNLEQPISRKILDMLAPSCRLKSVYNRL